MYHEYKDDVMRKVLIITHAMEIGGAERALLGLLNSFDYSKYSIDLFLCRKEGDLLRYIPVSVNILKSNQAQFLAVPMKNLIKEKQWKLLYGRIKAKVLSIIYVKSKGLKRENQVELTYSHKYTVKYFDFINSDITYDLAISFLTPHYICVNKCNAKRKIAWIHTDYSTVDIDIKEELKMWTPFDFIVSISDKCTDAFLSVLPSLKKKIIRIDNILSSDIIISQSNEFVPVEMRKEDNEYIFCSIGRFCYPKNFDSIPEICKYLLTYNINFKWFLIGYGPDEKLIRDRIKKERVDKYIYILGKKTNPYPYVKACDFYIQPSRYEGKAIAVREAQILYKPVIITNYPTSSSQLLNGIDGFIVSNDNNSKCAKDIASILEKKDAVKKVQNYLKKTNYENKKEVEKLYRIIEEEYSE